MKQTRRQFVHKLFVATQATLAASVLPQTLWGAGSIPGGLNFLVLGDWGRNGEKDQQDVATQMAVAAKEFKAGFVLAVGDNFYERGVESVTDSQWQTSFENVYSAPSLQVPWHAILGNHDYRGNCDAQIHYSRTSRRWKMPARYFQRTEALGGGRNADFFFIDTSPMAELGKDKLLPMAHLHSQDVGKQIAWLDSALAASKAPWKIVVGHHPVYSGGGHGDTPYLVEHVLPLMEKHQVQVYFNGHDHDLQHLQAGRVNFFCSGAGSKIRPTAQTPRTRFAKGCSGFAAVSLQSEQMQVRMIDDQGRLLYTAEVPRIQG